MNPIHALRCALLGLALAASAVRADEPLAVSAAADARNSLQAVAELCRVALRGDTESQYQLAWIYTHGRGADRRDDWAAYLFFAAGSRGHQGARQMLQTLTWPAAAVPDCFTESVVAAPEPITPGVSAPPHIEMLVRQLAPQYKVPPTLALAIIAVESNFNAAAQSPKNAQGLMQLIPDTARRFGVSNAFDAQQNIRGGMAYLRWLLAYFEGNVTLVAAAYNAGEGAVDRHRGVPPFGETREYVRRVVARVGSAALPFDARVVAPSLQLPLMRTAARLD